MEVACQPFICRAETDSYASPAPHHLANLFDITGRALLGLSSGDFFVRPEPVGGAENGAIWNTWNLPITLTNPWRSEPAFSLRVFNDIAWEKSPSRLYHNPS